MPELPEVERVLRTLTPVVGARIESVQLVRPDVTRHANRPARPSDLLLGARVSALRRHGKQLAILGDNGRALCVGLGMTGALLVVPHGKDARRLDHAHVIWTLAGIRNGATSGGPCHLVFQDPRRFGQITCFESFDALVIERWNRLGPDALTITYEHVRRALRPGARAVKSALLDQGVLAGVGNIYADESLFRAGISPRRRASTLSPREIQRLARAIRSVLAEAIDAGGSTIRDYRDAGGAPGSFQDRHMVYGRAGLPCRRCATTLRRLTIAQRTTVMCPRCQSQTP